MSIRCEKKIAWHSKISNTGMDSFWDRSLLIGPHLYITSLYKKADSSENYYPDFAICHRTLTFVLDTPSKLYLT